MHLRLWPSYQRRNDGDNSKMYSEELQQKLKAEVKAKGLVRKLGLRLSR